MSSGCAYKEPWTGTQVTDVAGEAGLRFGGFVATWRSDCRCRASALARPLVSPCPCPPGTEQARRGGGFRGLSWCWGPRWGTLPRPRGRHSHQSPFEAPRVTPPRGTAPSGRQDVVTSRPHPCAQRGARPGALTKGRERRNAGQTRPDPAEATVFPFSFPGDCSPGPRV